MQIMYFPDAKRTLSTPEEKSEVHRPSLNNNTICQQPQSKLLKRIEMQQIYNFMIETGAMGRGDSEFGLITWGSLLPTPEMPPRSQVSVHLFYCLSFAMLTEI